jgi:hypothetical protein
MRCQYIAVRMCPRIDQIEEERGPRRADCASENCDIRTRAATLTRRTIPGSRQETRKAGCETQEIVAINDS